jgi:hypothetical protein
MLTLSRISRVKEIREGQTSISDRAPVQRTSSKTRAEIEAARKRFLDSYMKHLP